MTKKYCYGCKTFHELDQFGLKASSPDGHKQRCKKWTIERHSIQKHERPVGSVEKVCPTCNKHIDVLPTESSGVCPKCGSNYYLSPSRTANNGVDIWVPRGKTNNPVSPKVVSFLSERKCIEKSQLLNSIDAHRVSVGRALSSLKEKGIVIEKWENHVCYVELSA